MQLKIFNYDQLVNILNICSLVAHAGVLPNQRSIENPEHHSGYWYRDGDKFQLGGNNYWAFVQEECEEFIVIELRYRYDTRNVMEHLTQMLGAFFGPGKVEIL